MEPSSPPELLNRMLTGYWTTQAIYVAAKLGIADLLKHGPRSAHDLAHATKAHAPSLYRLLRALASIGVFADNGAGRFSLTPLAECLRSDVPGSQRALAIMCGEEHYQAFGELLYSVQTGKTAFDKLYGMPVFDFLSKNLEQAKTFDAAMVGVHGRETAAMMDAYDFSGIAVLADIGGGNGSLLAAVLKNYPAMQGILYDQPGVAERAQANLLTAGLGRPLQSDRGQLLRVGSRWGGCLFDATHHPRLGRRKGNDNSSECASGDGRRRAIAGRGGRHPARQRSFLQQIA